MFKKSIRLRYKKSQMLPDSEIRQNVFPIQTFSLLFDILLKIRSENALFLFHAEEVSKNVILKACFRVYCVNNEIERLLFYECNSASSSQKRGKIIGKITSVTASQHDFLAKSC